MTREEIQAVFDAFFEFPGNDRGHVTSVSCRLFAERIAEMERESCAKVCDREARRALFNWHNDIPANQKFWNGGEQLASSCSAAIRARGQA